MLRLSLLLVVLAAVARAVDINATRPTEQYLDTCKLALVWNGTWTEPVQVLGRDGECNGCIPTLLVTWTQTNCDQVVYVQAPTQHGFYLYFASASRNLTLWDPLGDRGVFVVAASSAGLAVSSLTAPYNVALPLVAALLVYGGALVLFLLGYFGIYKRLAAARAQRNPKKQDEEGAALLVNAEGPSKESLAPAAGGGVPRSGSRLFSIDTFRGMCLAVMIFVNYGGGGYWWLEHSLWEGLTVADLVFPWFVFLMGVSITLSLSSILTRPPVDWWLLLYKVVRRTAILFAMGLIVNNCFVVQQCRVPGVLQRFAVSYFFTTLIVLFVPRLSCRCGGDTHTFSTARAVYLDRLLEWAVVLLLVLLWLLLTFFLPVPGCPTGYIGPGGAELGPVLANCTGGSARYIDLAMFGENHIYGSPTCHAVYDTLSYDPEGLLGCLTSIFICYLGVQCGRVFVAFRKSSPTALYVHLAVQGAVLAATGAALAGFSQFGGAIPIVKNLWSLSFVLVMAGTGFLVSGVVHFVVDQRQWWNGSPFRQLGLNSIFLYFGHEIMSRHFPFQFFLPMNTTHGLMLLDSALGATLWVIVALYCYWIDFQVKI